MQSYGNSFGFRRSNEHLHSGPESRLRVPTLATTWKQGDLVKQNPASPTELMLAADGDAIAPGVVGLLIQNERFVTVDHITQTAYVTTRDLSRTHPGQLANLVTGAGIKIWLKNLAADTRIGHKQYAAETRITLASVIVGSYIKWDGLVYEVGTDETDSVARCTKVIAGVGIEMTLLR